MRDHHRVEPPHVEPGKLAGTGAVREAGVHEDGARAVLHQNCVPLPDVEDAHARALEHASAEGERKRDSECKGQHEPQGPAAWAWPSDKDKRGRGQRDEKSPWSTRQGARRPGKARQSREDRSEHASQDVEDKAEGLQPWAYRREEGMCQPNGNHRIGNG